MVSILAFHAGYPGSSPGIGIHYAQRVITLIFHHACRNVSSSIMSHNETEYNDRASFNIEADEDDLRWVGDECPL